MKIRMAVTAIILLVCVASVWAAPDNPATNGTAPGQSGHAIQKNVHTVVTPRPTLSEQPKITRAKVTPVPRNTGGQGGAENPEVHTTPEKVKNPEPMVSQAPPENAPRNTPVTPQKTRTVDRPFTCTAGQYRNLGQCVSDCQAGGKQNCELTCKACVRVVEKVTPVPVKVRQNVTPVPVQPASTRTPFTCTAGQYRNLGQCVSDCQAGGKQNCELTCKACVRNTESATGLALLVRNAAALDAEENAALQFAQTQGISVTIVDAAMVKSHEGTLSGYQGYWADSDTEPVEWKDPVALAALKGELESGKHLFMMAGSMYLGQYLGYGRAGIDAWGPCVLDEVYLVDPQVSSHRVLSGLSSWIPPSKPDNPDQLLWTLRRTGGWSHYTFKGNNEIAVQATGLWVRYGYATGSPSPYPVLDARYGITSTGERFLFSFPIFHEVTVGQGSIGYEGVVFHLAREWGLGPMGEKLLTNKIKWALGE